MGRPNHKLHRLNMYIVCRLYLRFSRCISKTIFFGREKCKLEDHHIQVGITNRRGLEHVEGIVFSDFYKYGTFCMFNLNFMLLFDQQNWSQYTLNIITLGYHNIINNRSVNNNVSHRIMQIKYHVNVNQMNIKCDIVFIISMHIHIILCWFDSSQTNDPLSVSVLQSANCRSISIYIIFFGLLPTWSEIVRL